MSPFAAVAVKALGATAVAALLSAGVVSAATPSPSPSPSAGGDKHPARHAVVRTVVDSEAQVLGVKPEELRKDLKEGKTVSDLAKARGMTREQFATKLVADLKPRLKDLVDHKVITQAQADKILDRISKGKIPFWDGVHHRK
ncbi:MAG TPA: hypothetical protein VJU79_05665 [Candidatus Dormibacteraeota bacterium]|nr:hypothetical protein [Candidatus Dormibacteraeota bacterium]